MLIRKHAAQSMMLELRLKARAARFVPVTLKMQNNRLFTLSHPFFLHFRKTKKPDFQETGILSGATGNRTRDTRIFSPLLYQLSYGTVVFGIAKVISFFDFAKFSLKNFRIY